MGEIIEGSHFNRAFIEVDATTERKNSILKMFQALSNWCTTSFDPKQNK